MRLRFDNQAKIAGIGIQPWPRLGLEQWFDNFTIASLYDWGSAEIAKSLPKLLSMAGSEAQLKQLNSQNLINFPPFQRMLIDNLAGYQFITYRPVAPPDVLTQAGCRFLSVDSSLSSRFENKAIARQIFSDYGIPFPKFKIVDRSSIQPNGASLGRLLDEHEAVVLQDEKLSGGQGTFVIRDKQDLHIALDYLKYNSVSRQLVISKFIANAHERSLQCCITKYGIYIGHLQKQIVADPLLANLDVVGAGRFCGSEIVPDDPFIGARDEIEDYAKTIGRHMQAQGYRGIFGIDCLVNDKGQVYILEINPRLTGITPLLTKLYRPEHDIPFYLLHTLELAGLDYQITDDYIDPKPLEAGMMVLHAWPTRQTKLVSTVLPGLYNMESQSLMDQKVYFNERSETRQLIAQPLSIKADVPAGGRILQAYVNHRILDDQDIMLPDTVKMIDWLKAQTLLQEEA